MDKKFVVYDPKIREFWIYQDKSDVARKIGVTRNTVINRLKGGVFEKRGYVIGEAELKHSGRGSRNIDQIKQKS